MLNFKKSFVITTLSLCAANVRAEETPAASPTELSTAAPAQETVTHVEDAGGFKTEWAAFRLTSVNYFQKSGSTFSAALTWSPQWDLNGMWGVRLDLGASYLKKDSTHKFPMAEVIPMASYAVSDAWVGEMGFGVEYWLDNGGIEWTGAVNAVYRVKDMSVLDRLVVGYKPIFAPNKLTHQFDIGVGFTF